MSGGDRAKLRVGVAGGAGYTGGELLRLLLGHPRIELGSAASSTYPGEPLHRAHPHLKGRTDLAFTRELEPEGLDAVFLATAHGESMGLVPRLLDRAGEDLRIVDLAGDFRLAEASLYERWYGRRHEAPGFLGRFAYGLTELNRAAVAEARWVANPGCFATAVGLALGPLARAGLGGEARVTAMTGSSGSGAKPSATTHHPTRAANVRAYQALTHRHVPEVEALLDRLAGKPSMRVGMVPVSGPFVRGIYAVSHVELADAWSETKVRDLYATLYGDCPFVRLLDEPPEVQAVAGSNCCHLHVSVRGRRCVVISTLDNLVKGASGQAVQNLNVMMGWDETLGLFSLPPYP